MIQKDDYRHLVVPPNQNKPTRTILVGILYFLFGALTCIGLLVLLLAFLLS